jgi:hypothetical protein
VITTIYAATEKNHTCYSKLVPDAKERLKGGPRETNLMFTSRWMEITAEPTKFLDMHSNDPADIVVVQKTSRMLRLLFLKIERGGPWPEERIQMNDDTLAALELEEAAVENPDKVGKMEAMDTGTIQLKATKKSKQVAVKRPAKKKKARGNDGTLVRPTKTRKVDVRKEGEPVGGFITSPITGQGGQISTLVLPPNRQMSQGEWGRVATLRRIETTLMCNTQVATNKYRVDEEMKVAQDKELKASALAKAAHEETLRLANEKQAEELKLTKATKEEEMKLAKEKQAEELKIARAASNEELKIAQAASKEQLRLAREKHAVEIKRAEAVSQRAKQRAQAAILTAKAAQEASETAREDELQRTKDAQEAEQALALQRQKDDLALARSRQEGEQKLAQQRLEADIAAETAQREMSTLRLKADIAREDRAEKARRALDRLAKKAQAAEPGGRGGRGSRGGHRGGRRTASGGGRGSGTRGVPVDLVSTDEPGVKSEEKEGRRRSPPSAAPTAPTRPTRPTRRTPQFADAVLDPPLPAARSSPEAKVPQKSRLKLPVHKGRLEQARKDLMVCHREKLLTRQTTAAALSLAAGLEPGGVLCENMVDSVMREARVRATADLGVFFSSLVQDVSSTLGFQDA